MNDTSLFAMEGYWKPKFVILVTRADYMAKRNFDRGWLLL
jgi:hypothetical protein